MTTPDFTNLRVGYVPHSRDLTAPGDRRRFCRYAKLRKIPFETLQSGRSYDVIVVSSSADVTDWSRRPRDGTKIVFDLPDSYLQVDEENDLKARLRGPAKFLFRQHKHLEWSYVESLRRMFDRADAIVCSTPEQRAQISPFAQNVHPILDFYDGDIRTVKTDFKAGQPFNFLWEGLAVTAFMLAVIGEVLARLSKRRPLAVHILTDLQLRLVNGPVPGVPTRWMVNRYLPGIRTFLYEWNDIMFSRIATACDLGLIPVRMDIPLCRAKAENKLLLLWRTGLPTLTSATPAYVRTMDSAGIDAYCRTAEEWESKLEHMMDEEEARRRSGERGRAYMMAEHSESRRAEQWDGLFESILKATQTKSKGIDEAGEQAIIARG